MPLSKPLSFENKVNRTKGQGAHVSTAETRNLPQTEEVEVVTCDSGGRGRDASSHQRPNQGTDAGSAADGSRSPGAVLGVTQRPRLQWPRASSPAGALWRACCVQRGNPPAQGCERAGPATSPRLQGATARQADHPPSPPTLLFHLQPRAPSCTRPSHPGGTCTSPARFHVGPDPEFLKGALSYWCRRPQCLAQPLKNI